MRFHFKILIHRSHRFRVGIFSGNSGKIYSEIRIETVSLAACGGSQKDAAKTASVSENGSDTAASATSASSDHKETPETTDDAGKTEISMTPTPTEKAIDGTEVSTKLITLTYTDDWTLDEELTTDNSDYCSLDLTIPQDGSEDALVEISITASVSEPYMYRDELMSSGIDAYALVEEKSVNTTDIGGIPCVEYEREYWSDVTLNYLGRDETSGTTVSVTIFGDYEDTRVKDLISSVEFTPEDTGKKDPPWPWNGEAFSTDAQHTFQAGNHTVTADWIQLEDPLMATDIFSGRVEVIGDTVWVLLDNVLYEYRYSDNALTSIGETDLSSEGSYEELSSDVNGRLYVSGFAEQMLIMENGEIIGRIESLDKMIVHSSGTWGVSSFYGQTLEKITLNVNEETAQSEEWPLRAAEETADAFLSQNHVFVTGTSLDKDNETVWVFDTEGNQQFEFGNASMDEPGWMGSITDVAETANGFVVFDGNMRSLFFYGIDGSLIASADDAELFGTGYPWISSASLMPDGSLLIALTEEREDQSAYELLLYRLSGF